MDVDVAQQHAHALLVVTSRRTHRLRSTYVLTSTPRLGLVYYELDGDLPPLLQPPPHALSNHRSSPTPDHPAGEAPRALRVGVSRAAGLDPTVRLSLARAGSAFRDAVFIRCLSFRPVSV